MSLLRQVDPDKSLFPEATTGRGKYDIIEFSKKLLYPGLYGTKDGIGMTNL
jgi:hypothetical protein